MSRTDFIDLCNWLSTQSPNWVLSGEDSVSLKDGNHLWLKSETGPMAEIDLQSFRQGFLKIDPQHDAEGAYLKLIKKSTRAQGFFKKAKASSEAGLHALLPGCWVLHFQSKAALAMAQLFFDAEPKFYEWIKTNLSEVFLFLPESQSYYTLTRRLNENPNCRFYILQNCGLIFHSHVLESFESVIHALKDWQSIEKKFESSALNVT